jgi:hypothetical protein
MLQQQLDETKNLLKVANAKISAANHTLGCMLGDNNDLKATNILYQERERELMALNNELNQKILKLESELELHSNNSENKQEVDSPVALDSCQ